MKQPRILVVGSSNTDMVVRLPKLPVPGETILGDQFAQHPGGKGANQAVAAARAGGQVTFLACVGQDHLGSQAIEGFKQDGIHVSYIKQTAQASSGVALILVGPDGQNSIGVASGANHYLLPEDIDQHQDLIAESDCVLLQLETPLSTVTRCVELAHHHKVRVILNPAPAQVLPTNLLQYIEVLTPNETEAETLTGIAVRDVDSTVAAAKAILAQGVKTVIITLGEKGAFLLTETKASFIEGFSVKAVDATAAGDTFNGALSVALSRGWDMTKAIRFAHAAAALSVTQKGAQPSIPSLTAVEQFILTHHA